MFYNCISIKQKRSESFFNKTYTFSLNQILYYIIKSLKKNVWLNEFIETRNLFTVLRSNYSNKCYGEHTFLK